MKGVTARARVRLTIEVETDTWGPACSVEQVFKQAAEKGTSMIHNNLKNIGYSVVDCKVIGVFTEEEK